MKKKSWVNDNKKEKQKYKSLCESLRFQTAWRAKTLYPAMNGGAAERMEQELTWIERNGLVTGFLQLKEIMDMAYSHLNMTIGSGRGFLGGSIVAYCLGLTAEDPIAAGRFSTEFRQADYTPCLNVSIYFDPEKRNEAVALAETKFSKAMMRAGLPIIKLDKVILEFRRNLSSQPTDTNNA